MEHTGIYNYLLDYFSGKYTTIWLESALRIKHSVGLQGGKNDYVDAERIAFYAYRIQDNVQFWQAKHLIIKELKTLKAIRTRLINAQKQLKSSLQVNGEF